MIKSLPSPLRATIQVNTISAVCNSTVGVSAQKTPLATPLAVYSGERQLRQTGTIKR
jgi:hypothetical protein